ncbi:MAG: PilZ domain-containing protein [Acidobacteriota bacterium]|nr:PilZ domain-containing protein [Acidobacteriota bacterium]
MTEEEKRHSVRVAARLEIQYRADDVETEGFIDDLSETGAWIDTPQPLPTGTRVDFTFELHDDQADVPITGSATVVRVQEMVGMALEFNEVEPEAAARIRFWVGALYFGQDPAELF